MVISRISFAPVLTRSPTRRTTRVGTLSATAGRVPGSARAASGFGRLLPPLTAVKAFWPYGSGPDYSADPGGVLAAGKKPDQYSHGGEYAVPVISFGPIQAPGRQ